MVCTTKDNKPTGASSATVLKLWNTCRSRVYVLAHVGSTDVEAMIDQISAKEPLITDSKRPHVRKLLHKLIEKQVGQRTLMYVCMYVHAVHCICDLCVCVCVCMRPHVRKILFLN